MRKVFKRAAAAVMSAVMMFTQLPEFTPKLQKANADMQEIAGDETIKELQLSSLVLDCTDEEQWFSYTPSEDGIYEISSFGENVDSDVFIYNDEADILDYASYIDEENDNFFLAEYLTSGETYYYCIRFNGGDSCTLLFEKKSVTDLETGKINYIDKDGTGNRWFRFKPGKASDYRVASDAKTVTYLSNSWQNYRKYSSAVETIRLTDLEELEEECEVFVCVDQSLLAETEDRFMLSMVEAIYDPEYGIQDKASGKRNYSDSTVTPGDEINLEVEALNDREIVYAKWYKVHNSEVTLIQKGAVKSLDYTFDTLGDIECYAFDKYFNYDDLLYTFSVDNSFIANAKGPTVLFATDTAESFDFEVEATATDPSNISYEWYYYDDKDRVVIGTTPQITVEKPFRASYFCEVNDGYGSGTCVEFSVISDFTVLHESEPFVFTTDVLYKGFVFTPDNDGKYSFCLDNMEGSSEPGLAVVDSTGEERSCFDTVINENRLVETYELEGGSRYYLQYICNGCSDCRIEVYPYMDNDLRIYPEEKVDESNSVSLAMKLNASRELKVVAKADDTEGIKYQWYKMIDDEEQIMEGETGTSLTVTKENKTRDVYVCVVADNYRNIAKAYFYITLDNELQAWSKGTDKKNFDFVSVKSGETELTLEVAASVVEGDISYDWRSNDEEVSLGDESMLTVSAPFGSEYVCVVSDDYGNKMNVTFLIVSDIIPIGLNDTRTGELNRLEKAYFSFTPEEDGTYIFDAYDVNMEFTGAIYLDGVKVADEDTYWSSVNNGPNRMEQYFDLSGGKTYIYTLEINSDNKKADYELTVMQEKDNNLSVSSGEDGYFSVKPGTKLTLQPVVTGDDVSGLRYEWTKNDTFLQGQSGSSMEITVTENPEYRVTVFDKYGNNASCNFEIYIENELKAWIKGKENKTSENVILDPETQSLTFEIEYSAIDTDGIEISWASENEEFADKTGPTATFTAPFSQNYYCYVTDKYGNNEDVQFKIISDMTEIKNGETKTQTVNSYESKWFSFTPEKDGVYVFVCKPKSYDIYGVLYDAESNRMEASDFEETRYELKAGKTYYYQLTNYEDYEDETDSETVSLTVYEYIENHLEAWVKGSRENDYYKKTAWFIVQPDVAKAKLEIEYAADDEEGIVCTWKSSDDETGNGTVAEVTAADGKKVVFYVNDRYGNEEKVEFYLVEIAGSISCNETIELKSGEDDFSYYMFVPQKAGYYKIYSSGSIDTAVDSFLQIGEYAYSDRSYDDQDNGDTNFCLEFKVYEANVPIYFNFYALAGEGSYSVTLEETEKPEDLHTVNLQVYDSKDKGTIVIQRIIDGEDYEDEIFFDVSCPEPCMVLVSDDGGETYTRLEAFKSDEPDVHVFNILLESDVDVVIVKAGDFNLDGRVDSADALQMLRYDVGKLTDVSAVQLFAGNVSGDEVIDSADALQVLRYDVGKTSFEW